MSIFKPGSIRGHWGTDWNEETAYSIGYHLTGILGWKHIVIGRDGRLSSDIIYEQLVKGLNRGGCRVTSIGMIDTPGVSFANINYGFDGSIMITASHNPPEFNGLKINGKNGLVINRHNGLTELEKRSSLPPDNSIPSGENAVMNIHDDYLKKILKYKKGIGDLNCVVDCSNGMASKLIHRVLAVLPGEYTLLNTNIDGHFPGHGPNPTDEKNLEELKQAVIREKADLGICFDGDGDRAIFVNEKGKWISPDLIMGILGLYYFKHFPEMRGGRDCVLYDARCSNSVKDYIRPLGGTPLICSTGHTAMQVGLPEKNGIYGGELPGHYYYYDFYSQDNGWIPFLQVLAVLSLEKRPFSSLISEINTYHFSGEINFQVPDGNSLLSSLKQAYSSGDQTYLDGVRVDFDDWWFLVRMANTEPILRLVVEGKSPEILVDKVKEISDFILSAGGVHHSH
jgi:phosphomannomutase